MAALLFWCFCILVGWFLGLRADQEVQPVFWVWGTIIGIGMALLLRRRK